MLAASDHPPIVRAAVRAGARGYALKNERRPGPAAIKEVAAGKDWISPRLAYILATDSSRASRHSVPRKVRPALYATGMPMKSVAQQDGIGEETVKQYLGRVRQKYAEAGRAAPTKLELYHRAVEDGHLPPTSLTSHPPPGGYGARKRPSSALTSLLPTLLRARGCVMTPYPGVMTPAVRRLRRRRRPSTRFCGHDVYLLLVDDRGWTRTVTRARSPRS